ncbi:uncharacterized protein BP5553_00163 [Venustampulla echinocandica]|uniref:Zn(2)-C6 fungal-type domain-containing protein n=1 Tax=Venustampulla echinocandica TaxID=2656787 RepID=A0A370TXC3_9HELO|nr:uncharacterized protein BP5553_00163 [Venustampulla echinocandica]RDL40184.1 hypothetical protein BP5553_00163 [Venustampulla echinocandica]
MPPKRPHPDDSNETSERTGTVTFSRSRACAECKKHKIRCEWKAGQASCAKCHRSGVECITPDFSQRFIEEDTAWKAATSANIEELQAAVSHILQLNLLPDLASYQARNIKHASSNSPRPLAPLPPDEGSRSTAKMPAPSIAMTRENSQEPEVEHGGEIVPAPMRSLYELTRLKVLGNGAAGKSKGSLLADDFISRGVITLGEAEELFAHYYQKMNQYLWAGLLLTHDNLESLRHSSSMLCTVILTVAAIHKPNKAACLDKCYAELVSLVSANALSRYNSLDDLRALALGAFYLPTLSWRLCRQAVSIATEMNLHRSFQKLTQPTTDHHESARIWYVLFVCDRQFSIAYGRPPMTMEDAAIKNYERILQGPEVLPGDVRLGAQVALFSILTDAYQRFGTDMDQILTEDDFARLRTFNVAVEEWRLVWKRRSDDSPFIGTYPSKGVVLYYYFARFQLNSLAFRGMTSLSAAPLAIERKEAANIAISAAISTLSLIVDEPDLCSGLACVPVFTHTMIAFCAAFLLQVAARWGNSETLSIDVRQVLAHVGRVANVMDEVKQSIGESHLVRHMALGFRKMLKNFRVLEPENGVMHAQHSTNTPIPLADGHGLNMMQYQPQNQHPQQVNGEFSEFQEFDQGDNGETPPTDFLLSMMHEIKGTYGFGFDEQLLNPLDPANMIRW